MVAASTMQLAAATISALITRLLNCIRSITGFTMPCTSFLLLLLLLSLIESNQRHPFLLLYLHAALPLNAMLLQHSLNNEREGMH